MKPEQNQGMALITAIILLFVLFVLGTSLILLGGMEFKISKSFTHNTRAFYVAEAGLQQIVAKQNNPGWSPRYLFRPATYQTMGVNPYLVDYSLTDPDSGAVYGTTTLQVVNDKNPMVDNPPYRVRATALSVGATRIIEADIAPLSLLQYAVYSEASVYIASYITINGKTYSAANIQLTGPNVVFNNDVEYVGALLNESYGEYNGEVLKLPAPWPGLTTLVDLAFFEQAGKQENVCSENIGLYIGPDPGAKNNALFQRSPGVYEIDLTLFDFSGVLEEPSRPVEYNGTKLLRFNSLQFLDEFSGVIFVDGELHVWGINGGRSVEDYSVLDKDKPLPASKRYPGPNGNGENRYSNNRLDPGEDGSNGGDNNGILDPAGLGLSLTIVTNDTSDVYIDHNIFMGTRSDGAPVNIALISGDSIYVSEDSPKTIVIEAALLARGVDSSFSWYPLGDASSHQANYWALNGSGDFEYDLDNDGVLETDNNLGQSSDRNEFSMLNGWSLIQYGNLITKGRPVSGIWASAGHIRIYEYNPSLLIAEPPCYPVIPVYDIVPGSWLEMQ